MSVLALRLACLGAGLVWAVCVCLIGFLPLRLRGWAACIAILIGVPILGLLTWRLGPMVGLAALIGGAALLIWPPALALRRRRNGQFEAMAHADRG